MAFIELDTKGHHEMASEVIREPLRASNDGMGCDVVSLYGVVYVMCMRDRVGIPNRTGVRDRSA